MPTGRTRSIYTSQWCMDLVPLLFADDTQIIAHAPPPQFNDLVTNIGADANAVYQWAIANGLSLNTQKSRVLLLGSRVFTNALYRARPPKVTLTGTMLEHSPASKSLEWY
ncbi:hypothetical protein TKK_0008773 [Trichogramma kaykai]